MSDDQPQEYTLVLDLAGPSGYRDRVEIASTELDELRMPTSSRGVGDAAVFERYGDEDDYTEIRADLIVKRSLFPTPASPKPSSDQTGDPS